MNSMSVIITSYHQRDFTLNCIKSYNWFCPNDLDLKLIVIENSSDISYKDEALALGDNITWVNHLTDCRGANANAVGIEVGMKYVDDDYVFLSHNDVCITSSDFFYSMKEKVEEGNQLIGTCYDIHPLRHFSIIVLGCLVKSDIVRSVDLYPLNRPDGKPHFETGDRVHMYCKENNIPYLCFLNTHNNPGIRKNLPEPYKDLPFTLTTIDHKQNVIFLHFARGTTKTFGTYPKHGRLNVPQIIEFCENKIFNTVNTDG